MQMEGDFSVSSFDALLRSDQVSPIEEIEKRKTGEAESIDLTWQRGDKFARGVVTGPGSAETAETAGADREPAIPVKSHVRNAPAGGKRPVTLDAIMEEYRKTIRKNTARHLFMGDLVDTWLRRPPEEAWRGLPRAALVLILEQRVDSEGLEGRPNRDLKCFHAAKLLGGDAESLTITSIREMLRLVERNGDRWRLAEAHEPAARKLWGRMLGGRMRAEDVRAEVDRILPRHEAKSASKQYSRQAATVLRILPHLTSDELLAIRLELKRCEREAKARKGESSPAAA